MREKSRGERGERRERKERRERQNEKGQEEERGKREREADVANRFASALYGGQERSVGRRTTCTKRRRGNRGEVGRVPVVSIQIHFCQIAPLVTQMGLAHVEEVFAIQPLDHKYYLS